jgi:thiosulfate/3-mercaptopyruvate sulfurtransferase
MLPGVELPGMLVDPRWLLERRSTGDRNSLVLADVRWVGGGSAREAYERGHLPGAVLLDADTDLAASPFDGPGRHPLPAPQAFAAAMEHAGIGDDSAVIAYDDVGGSVAARLWWMLRVLDRDVAMLDLPSLDAWVQHGGALETGPARPARSVSFTLMPWPADRIVDAVSVRRILREGSAVLLDARAGERYRGETEPIDPVAGHVPGAVSAEWAGNRGSDGRLLDPAALRRRYESFGVREGGDPIASCGSGLTASLALFSMERAGLGLGRLYEGSWSDWISDPSRPVATGSQPGRPT